MVCFLKKKKPSNKLRTEKKLEERPGINVKLFEASKGKYLESKLFHYRKSSQESNRNTTNSDRHNVTSSGCAHEDQTKASSMNIPKPPNINQMMSINHQ
ncbi:hypothetical protein RDI58_017905 [Solanum bulbocastanum]|uniref:Uncharacterized protein n=1 Tax=Solanum bulbocastanum TaxID=147425 RepID=A0AAN8Y998_SOLBU